MGHRKNRSALPLTGRPSLSHASTSFAIVDKTLRAEAFNIGANAVVAFDLAYREFSGGKKSMLVAVATGAAVELALQ